MCDHNTFHATHSEATDSDHAHSPSTNFATFASSSGYAAAHPRNEVFFWLLHVMMCCFHLCQYSMLFSDAPSLYCTTRFPCASTYSIPFFWQATVNCPRLPLIFRKKIEKKLRKSNTEPNRTKHKMASPQCCHAALLLMVWRLCGPQSAIVARSHSFPASGHYIERRVTIYHEFFIKKFNLCPVFTVCRTIHDTSSILIPFLSCSEQSRKWQRKPVISKKEKQPSANESKK